MIGFRERLLERCALSNIALPAEDEVARLGVYFDLLMRWNQRINLTSLRLDDPLAIDRLIIEPVAAAAFLPPGAISWLDVGSGGGSPAIPLKILRPETRLTMVESRERKTVFLQEVARALGLTGVVVETKRFETFARQLQERVDVLTLRAVKFDREIASACNNTLDEMGRLLIFQTAREGSAQFPELLRTIDVVPLTLRSPTFLHILVKSGRVDSSGGNTRGRST
ncbi:MAG: 16S rRNA (guanine(527)-N(7))-methyltransferase RsmG [Acidobacteria bacterium]|nr:16S rRNA (guanine(527)-N(7))-methyltransferase RsmG [Acidobacteriota bacterium]